MERLTKKELRALFEFIKECYPICDFETFAQRVVSRLSKIVPTEIIPYVIGNGGHQELFVGRRETDVAKTLRPVYGATIASLLLFCLVGPRVARAQIFAGEAETNPKGKPATKADFVLTVKDNLISLKAKDALLKEVFRSDRVQDENRSGSWYPRH